MQALIKIMNYADNNLFFQQRNYKRYFMHFYSMKKYGSFFLLVLISIIQVQAQSGTLQIYCSEGAAVYLNEKYLGKTSIEMHGFLAEKIAPGRAIVSVYKNGFQSETQTAIISENQVAELTYELVKNATVHQKTLGVDLHFGTFGLFNVNNVFTKADYTAGVTPYFDIKLHRIFSMGTEVMIIFGKPKTADNPRMMLCSNIRLNLAFDPFEKTGFTIQVAGGFSFWPSNTSVPELTPTLNQTRTGWDFKAMAGAAFKINPNIDLNLNFGYWAASSTSDNIVWITHDSMLINIGPGFKF